jgi:phospholipid N-methyltransferase
MKINASSIISCLPPLIIAVVVSVAIPSFAMPQMRDQGELMQLQLRQLHSRLKLTEQQASFWNCAGTERQNKIKSRQARLKQVIREM